MRARTGLGSNVPEQFYISKVDDKAVIKFIDNVTSEEVTNTSSEDGEATTTTQYSADVYYAERPWQDNVADIVRANLAAFLADAKAADATKVGYEVRAQRNALLAATDVYAYSDRTMSDAMATYRQSLRDVPEQSGFPYDVVWPVNPA